MRTPTAQLILSFLLAIPASGAAWAEQQAPKELVVVAKIPRNGFSLAFDFKALWMMSDGRLVKVDPENSSAVDIDMPTAEHAGLVTGVDAYRGIAVGEGAVWVPDTAASAIYKVDPQENKVVLTIPTDIFGGDGSIGVGEGAVWVITFDSHNKTLTRYNAIDGAEEAKIALPRSSSGVLFAYGSVWVSATGIGELYRIDPKTNSVVATVTTHAPSDNLAFGDGSIWIAFESDGTLQRIDGQTGKILATMKTGGSDAESGGDIALGGGFVWVITRGSTLAQVDIATNSAKGTFRPAPGTLMGRRVRYGAGSLWISGPSIFRISPPK